MATGHRIIERGLRPDGTARKPIRVREGYHPPDEAVAYVPPHKKDQAQGETNANAPLSLESRLVEEEIPLTVDRPKTKSQLKNEKKNKNKREKRLELAKKRNEESENCRSDVLLDDTVAKSKDREISQLERHSKNIGTVKSKVTNCTSESNEQHNLNVFNGETEYVMDDSEKNRSIENSKVVEKTRTDDKKSMGEIQENVNEVVTDLERQQKKLRKKLDQITKLLQRDELNQEEKVKVGRRDEWEDEMKTIEKRLKSLKAS